MRANTMAAMILAGGRGSRLLDLTKKVAKPAVHFGGKYRIIDFPLSNCANSGISTVGVLTQYESVVLNSYVAKDQFWGLDTNDGGVYVLTPRERDDKGLEVYRGTADAITANLDFLDQVAPEYVLILSGDHIYKMNYAKMLAYHQEKQADHNDDSRYQIQTHLPSKTVQEITCIHTKDSTAPQSRTIAEYTGRIHRRKTVTVHETSRIDNIDHEKSDEQENDSALFKRRRLFQENEYGI